MPEFFGLHAVGLVGAAEFVNRHQLIKPLLRHGRIHVVFDFDFGAVVFVLEVAGNCQHNVAADELLEVVQIAISREQKFRAIAAFFVNFVSLLERRDARP